MSVRAPFRTQLSVLGMTCQHCAMSVTEQLAAVPGVSAVDVRLDGGAVTVLADREVGRSELVAAVAAAGFEAVGSEVAGSEVAGSEAVDREVVDRAVAGYAGTAGGP